MTLRSEINQSLEQFRSKPTIPFPQLGHTLSGRCKQSYFWGKAARRIIHRLAEKGGLCTTWQWRSEVGIGVEGDSHDNCNGHTHRLRF